MSRLVRAPRGAQRSCKGWPQEAALRMLMNNLDPDVAENPDRLIVYGGAGGAGRGWGGVGGIVRSLRELEKDETLLGQFRETGGGFRTPHETPRGFIAKLKPVG